MSRSRALVSRRIAQWSLAATGAALVILTLTQPVVGTEPMWRTALRAVAQTVGLERLMGPEQTAFPGGNVPGGAGEVDPVGAADPAGVDVAALEAEVAGVPGTLEAAQGEDAASPQGKGKGSATPGNGSGNPTGTPDPDAQESATPTPAVPSRTPTPSRTATATLHPRRLTLSRVRVDPAEPVVLELACDDLENAAGCDIGVRYAPDVLTLTEVRKTETTGAFLLFPRIGDGALTLSMASVDGLPPGAGVLLVFAGVAGDAPSGPVSTAVEFTTAKLYDVDSQRIPVSTEDGMVWIEAAPAESPTALPASPTPPAAASATPTPYPPGPTSTIAEPAPPTDTPADDDPPGPGTTPSTPSPAPSGTTTPSAPSPTGTPRPDDAPRLPTDLDGSGRVDHQDLLLFMQQWHGRPAQR